MLNIDKIITKFLFILSVSFFLASNVFAGGAIIDTTPSSVNVNEVKVEKNNTNTETLNLKLSSPTILSPKNDDIVSYDETITGAVSSGATVRIYVDGILDGEIRSWESKTGVSAFFYKPKQHLSEGIHFIKAQTVKNGFVSDFSKEVMIIKEGAYEAPVVRMPYYYKDDYKTFVVRGIAKSNDTIDIYLDGKKIKTLNLPKSTKEDGKVNFLYAIHNLEEGNHSGYFVAYESGTNRRSYDSKKFYFEVKNPENLEEKIASEVKETENNESTVNKTEEIKEEKKPVEEVKPIEETKKPEVITPKVEIKEETKQQDVENKKDTTNKEDSNNLNKEDKKVEEKKSSIKQDSDYEKNKSMTIGIVLLVCSIILMIFWIYSENQDRIKKFIDKLLDEDYDDDEDNKNKK